jgi:hypothetical protein
MVNEKIGMRGGQWEKCKVWIRSENNGEVVIAVF